MQIIVAPDLGSEGHNRAEDLIPLPEQADELLATLVAMDRLAQLYPDTFRMLLLAAREALRPMGIEARRMATPPLPSSYAREP